MWGKIENNEVTRHLSLPKHYKINRVFHNLSVLPVQTVNESGFFEWMQPVITTYQELIKVIPSDLIGNQFIQRVRDFTAQEISDYDELQIENAVNELLNNREQEGAEYFRTLRIFVKRKFDDAIITETQFKDIRVTLEPAIRPLRVGDWDLAQDNINAIILSRPNGILGQLYDKVKTNIDNYVTENY